MIVKKLIVGAIVVTFLSLNQIYSRAQKPAKVPTFATVSSDRIAIKSSKYTLSMRRGRTLARHKFIVAAVAPNNGKLSFEFGANSTAASFSTAIAKKFIKEAEDTSYCGAGFMNTYANHRKLFAANDEVKAKLSAWKRQGYHRVKAWERVSISGSCLTRPSFVSAAGEDITQHLNLEDEINNKLCQFILVDSIDVKPANLI